MSEANTPSGSTARRVAIHESICGYMAGKVAALGARVLGGVEPTADLEDPRVESGEELVRARRLIGKSTQTFQPAIGKHSGARLPSPNSLKTLRNEIVTGRADVADDRLELLHRGRRNDELVLQEARRTVGPVPLAEQVERVVEAGQVLDLVGVVAASWRYQAVAERGEGQLVRQAVGKDVRQVRRAAWRRRPAGRSQLGGELLQLGQGGQRAPDRAARPSFGGAEIASNQAERVVVASPRNRRRARRWSRPGCR